MATRAKEDLTQQEGHHPLTKTREGKTTGSQRVNITVMLTRQAVKRQIQAPLPRVAHGHPDSITRPAPSTQSPSLVSPWDRSAPASRGKEQGNGTPG